MSLHHIMKSVLVYCFDGCEPVEAISTIDALRRSGANVVAYGHQELLEMGHGITMKMDTTQIPKDLKDALVLPGGMGWKNLQADQIAKELTKTYIEANKIVAAICAAPSVALGYWGYLDGKKATCYPGMEKIGLGKSTYVKDRVVVDGNIITAAGPGVALEFGVQIAKSLGLDGGKVHDGMLIK